MRAGGGAKGFLRDSISKTSPTDRCVGALSHSRSSCVAHGLNNRSKRRPVWAHLAHMQDLRGRWIRLFQIRHHGMMANIEPSQQLHELLGQGGVVDAASYGVGFATVPHVGVVRSLRLGRRPAGGLGPCRCLLRVGW